MRGVVSCGSISLPCPRCMSDPFYTTRLSYFSFFHNFFSMYERCHVLCWFTEFSSVVLFHTFSLDCCDGCITHATGGLASYHCSRQLFIQCHGSGNLSINCYSLYPQRDQTVSQCPSMLALNAFSDFPEGETRVSRRFFSCLLQFS